MAGIFFEWIATAFLIALALYLLAKAWVRFTWFGKRWQRELHKTVIETGAEIRCPIHGKFPVSEGVETDQGEVCPICYKEFVEIPTFTIGPKDEKPK